MSQYLPKPYPRRRYYTPNDVSVHNIANDCFVSFFHQVYDLTPLIQNHITNKLCDPIVKAAGTDISHWFDPKTKDPRKCIDINTGLETFYCPDGPYLDIPPLGPNSAFD